MKFCTLNLVLLKFTDLGFGSRGFIRQDGSDGLKNFSTLMIMIISFSQLKINDLKILFILCGVRIGSILDQLLQFEHVAYWFDV